jgi:multidrug efflux pump subunit AcrA (membrane-fusion protein)
VLGDGTPYPHDGAIDFVDPTIEPTRGTVAVRAQVPNPEAPLKPGEFVRVIVVRPDVTDALLVPQRAVQEQQGGSYLLVVKDDGTVESRTVTIGVAHDGHAADPAGRVRRRARDRRGRAEGAARASKVAAREMSEDGVAAQKEPVKGPGPG